MANVLKKDSETDHFNGKVPQALRDKLLEMAQAIEADFISEQGGGFGVKRINAVYGYHISGFIPSQLGGYEISELYRSDMDSSYHFTRAQSEAMVKDEKYMYESFYRDNIASVNKRADDPKINENTFSYNDLEAYPKLRQAFGDYENDWFEPALLRLEIWVDRAEREARCPTNDGRQPENVYVRLGLNYKDQPYYRSNYDETLFEFNMPVTEFMACGSEAFIKLLSTKMKDVE